jgi:hypothetical protein
MEDLKIKNDKLVDEVLHLIDIIEEKDKKIEYLKKYISLNTPSSGSSG